MVPATKNPSLQQLLVAEMFPKELSLSAYQRQMSELLIGYICQGQYQEAQGILNAKSCNLPPWQTVVLRSLVLRLQLRHKLQRGEHIELRGVLNEQQKVGVSAFLQNKMMAAFFKAKLEQLYKEVELTLEPVGQKVELKVLHWEQELHRQMAMGDNKRFNKMWGFMIASLVAVFVALWM
ncbi:uncharacterized protein LOC117578486 [Drosophila guanche]|uniref:Uncharacterized protein n=1 Tax=Drosophila guanche TaxID=7266 RepID=A0A3B0IYG1_DROGU|nr:uncharacterized protein LOC117578486 [Drosophila guanche]SPP73094.1 Hypothetical predicted protein [Drosophila guanche]